MTSGPEWHADQLGQPGKEERTASVRFTIVTPVLNGMPWLPEAIGSVSSQRESVGFEIEHIVLDGGSIDGSREWLLGHPELGCDLRFQADHGQTDALSSGFGAAKGELLGWLNADDILEPGTLQTVHDLFAASPDVMMISGACLFIDPAGRVIGAMATPPNPTLEGLVQTRINPPQPSTFFRASAFSQVGGLDRGLNLAMDVDLWIRLARVGRYLVLPDRVLARYRIHPQAKSERLAWASAREDLTVRRRNGMKWRSPAGRELFRLVYVRRAFSPLRAIRRAVNRASSGAPRS
ncbi:MAG TPA: glycosyltransferase family 2 protein [Candidatus Limnocylindrales bacterium]